MCSKVHCIALLTNLHMPQLSAVRGVHKPRFLLSCSVRRFYVIIVCSYASCIMDCPCTSNVGGHVMDLLGTTACSTTCILNGLSPCFVRIMSSWYDEDYIQLYTYTAL